MSSFGGPGSKPGTKPTPPQRGSFPLDHEGECKQVMTNYLSCMQKTRGINQAECRDIAKLYLGCRMDHDLMAKDDFKNLGFQTAPAGKDGKSGEKEKGVPGELRW